jgi:hypothetical protein
MSLSQCHYDKPQSHNSTQTRWVLPAGKKIFAPSIKVLDLKITPNKDAYFPALVGAYACIKRVQLKVDNRLVDIWNTQHILPLLIANSGDNEKQKGINRALYGTGNNIVYNPQSKKLKLDRPQNLVADPLAVQLKLPVYLDLLNNIGVITSAIEIIIDWETNVNKVLCPLNPADPPTAFTINTPYLAYETLNGDFSQPNNVPFRMWLEDRFAVPAVGTDNTTQRYEIRSNAFNNKTIGRMLLVNTPASVENAAPSADCVQLYRTFGQYMSVPMKQENFNVAKDGRLIFSLRNVNNDAVKLSAVADAWGSGVFATNAHIHSVASVLDELQDAAQLNGFASFGAVEINDLVKKELQLTYMRVSDDHTDYPALGDQLIISAVAEVRCMLVDGLKVYV